MCTYVFRDGSQCQLEDAGKGLCIWHDPTINKSSLNLREELEQLASEGHQLEGFSLARANLEGLNLVKHGCKEGYSLKHCDLYRANLRGAHLFQIDLSEASLMKADLRDANLHFADLRFTNLLGTKLEGAKIENIEWGNELLQESKAKEQLKSQPKQAMDHFQQAEEIYRGLRKVSEHQGLFELAGLFFYREMIVRRMQMPLMSGKRLLSKLVDLFCGYGERPLRVILFSMCMILICAVSYFFVGVKGGDGMVQFSSSASLSENILTFFQSLYYSVVTFTTLGYGDIVPVGFSRVIAASEAFFGAFTLALFVVVFVKKMTR